MRNLKIVVAYVGTRYAGWQIQPKSPTVQGVLEAALSRTLGEAVRIAGAGRTDAGVHAHGQVANFATATRMPAAGLLRAINTRLPEDVRVLRVEEAKESFHARADALSKEYRYRIVRAEVVSPFIAPFVLTVRTPLDLEAMRRAARRLIGRLDFTSFCPTQCRVNDKVRDLVASEILEAGDEIEYRVRADGFLHHMVRTIVGTLLLVGRGRLAADGIAAILEARDRRAAGPVAPARGLVLERVFYEEGT
ncbi:MAG TPA: tRNA pseudouridine(38-40) synthase TruA [Candidatus Polarisedimenticolia bacterium]